ncbi:hypothetical protein Bca4012_051134 [Brassica carinata]|uniref:Uncharacterized protein n=1 Tax=Brassica carinata TaxID=52824 RepID=A0A8X7UM28_BRACI|nr:hypothetical protein Bca52824_053791 [Brassica carinata]
MFIGVWITWLYDVLITRSSRSLFSGVFLTASKPICNIEILIEVSTFPNQADLRVTWREKKHQPRHDKEVARHREERASADLLDGSYGHQAHMVSSSPGVNGKVSPSSSHVRMSLEQKSLGATVVTRRIASDIVTPSRSVLSLDGNVTKRLKGTPRSLAFDTLTKQDPKAAREDDQVIEALHDMDIKDQIDGGLMDCEMQNDDLMGLELAEMEDKTGHDRADNGAGQKSQKLAAKSLRHKLEAQDATTIV